MAVAAADIDPVLGTSTSLNIKVAAGTFRKCNGTAVTFAGSASTALPASTISSVYLDDSGNLNVSSTGFPAATNIVPLATVNAGPTTLVKITDQRTPFFSFGAAGTATASAPVANNTVYAGPATGTTSAAPSFRALVAADIPNLSATYGTLAGNQTFAGSNTFSQPITGSVTGTASTITGTITESQVVNLTADLANLQPHANTLDGLAAASYPASTLLGGQGTGVPASITLGSGLTLASGVLSANPATATVAVMGASGPNHATGLVPDPGAVAGTSRFLREDGTWVTPPLGTTIASTETSVLASAALARSTPPAVTGSRRRNAALASLLDTLASLGLIDDQTTP